MGNIKFENKIFEAISAADEALKCLKEAKKSLSSAKGWGIYDIVGGGFISTFIKRKKMANAQNSMKKAKDALKSFEDELDDIDDLVELNFNMHDFVSFADYFFDGFFSDLIIQNRINEANKKVNSVIMNVESIRNQLIRVLNS